MKKLQISANESIRTDGLRYNLTDLFRLTTLNGIRLEPWAWAQMENRTRDISRRGWFFKKSWAKAPVLVEYAKYLTPGLYRQVIRALDMDEEAKLIAVFGETKAARLDPRVASLLDERNESRAKRIRRENEEALDMMRKIQPVIEADRNVESLSRINADDLTKPTPRNIERARQTPTLRTTRSMSHSRSISPSVSHHRSEPDYLTQALLVQTVIDDTPPRFHDTCSTSSYSHDSGSWSGDSGSCGSGGGCD